MSPPEDFLRLAKALFRGRKSPPEDFLRLAKASAVVLLFLFCLFPVWDGALSEMTRGAMGGDIHLTSTGLFVGLACIAGLLSAVSWGIRAFTLAPPPRALCVKAAFALSLIAIVLILFSAYAGACLKE
jgi:hypothetical protein